MKSLIKTITVFGVGCAVASAQAQFTETVLFDDFNSYTDNSFVVAGQAQTALVSNGNGGNAIQYTNTTGEEGGFFAQGFDWVPLVQPGPGGPNTSTNLADYQITFDFTFTSTYIPGNAIEIWVKDEPSQSANLYDVGTGSFETGVTQTVSFTLEDPVTTDPFGYPGQAFAPTIDEWQIRINVLDFGSPASETVVFTVDNFELATVPEPSTVALLMGGLAVVFVVFRRRKG